MKASFNKIEEAMLASSENISFWLDKQNGNVIFYGDESVFGDLDYDEDEAEAIQDIKILCGEIEPNENIEIDESCYLEIIPPHSGEKWKWMEEFALAQQDNSTLLNKLADALRGKKPFRKFKDVLIYYPETEKKWFEFESQKLREFIKDWAELENLEIDFEN